MKIHEATEQAYKNGYDKGYEDGYRDGKNRAMEEIAFPKFLVRPHEPSKKELEDLLYSSPAIIATNEEIIPIYPYRWIPVTERLPEEDGYYLCNVRSFAFRGSFYAAMLKYDKGGFIEGHIYTDDVTHWMPLPEPPKGA